MNKPIIVVKTRVNIQSIFVELDYLSKITNQDLKLNITYKSTNIKPSLTGYSGCLKPLCK